MSEFRIDQIKNQASIKGPEIAGITTFTGTSGVVMPSGSTAARYTNGAISDSLIFYFDPTYDDCYAQPKAGGTQDVKDLSGYHPDGQPASANTTYDPEFRALNLTGAAGESDIQFNAVDNPALSPNDVTVETWFRIDGNSNNGYHVVFQKDGGHSGGSVFGNRVYDEDHSVEGHQGMPLLMICVTSDSKGQRYTYGPRNSIIYNKWYQLVGTYEAKPDGLQYSRSKLYINGVQVPVGVQYDSGGTRTYRNQTTFNKEIIWGPETAYHYGAGNVQTFQALPPLIGANQFHIGEGDSRNHNGDVAIVRVYGRALSAEEVNINFQTDRGRFEI